MIFFKGEYPFVGLNSKMRGLYFNGNFTTENYIGTYVNEVLKKY